MEKIREICKKHCGRDVGDDEELLQSGMLNSFQLLELICDLEEEFGIEFDPKELGEVNHFSSVRKMRELVGRKIGKRRI